jgi:CDP-diacylglycerol--serine O-phosphatidyltransferase
MVKFLPLFITALNACCGLIAIYINHPIYSSIAILLGGICDVFDGAAARWLNAQSEVGKQLDSLSDAITFGIAPAYLLYHHTFVYSTYSPYISLVACVMLSLFAIVRLAIFNTDTRQKDVFLGIPTPAMAMFFVGIVAHYHYNNDWLTEKSIMRFLLVLPFFFAALMVLPVKMLSFKKINIYFISVLIAAPVCLYAFRWAGLSVTIVAYILISCIKMVTDTFKIE